VARRHGAVRDGEDYAPSHVCRRSAVRSAARPSP
jgi:hypothetical protein